MEIKLYEELFKDYWAPDFKLEIKDVFYNGVGDTVLTPSRVSNVQPLIEIKKDIVIDGDTCGLFFLTRWCVHKYSLTDSDICKSGQGPLFLADRFAVRDCIGEGYLKKDIYDNFIKYLKHLPTKQNEQRIIECYKILQPSFIKRLFFFTNIKNI